MFFIDEAMTPQEIKKEITKLLKPIKVISKRFNVQVQYENKLVNADEMKSQIHELMLLLKQHKDEKQQIHIDKLHNLNINLDLFLKSVNALEEVERALIYYLLLADKTQTELTEHEEMYDLLEAEYPSQSKISRLFQKACFNLFELINYNKV